MGQNPRLGRFNDALSATAATERASTLPVVESLHTASAMNVAAAATSLSIARRSTVAIRAQRPTSRSRYDVTQVRFLGNQGASHDDSENGFAHCENPDGVKDARADLSIAFNTHNSQGRYAHAK